jgi:hypothetical protein
LQGAAHGLAGAFGCGTGIGHRMGKGPAG